MSEKLSITVLDGPIKISGDNITLRFAGEAIPLESGKEPRLCRCGKSSKAPFCDGSHRREAWVADAPEPQEKPVRVWEGKTIRTFFNPNVCMHVFDCKPLKDLRAAELAGDTDAATEIARVVQSCPSGALTYEAQPSLDLATASTVDIDVIEGGEIRIQTEFEINVELQERQPTNRATLCRCGFSKNKPWCDGQHRKLKDFR